MSFTFHGISGEGTIGNTTNEITLTNIAYGNCTINGSPGCSIDMNGCDYKLTGGSLGTTDGAQTHIECPGSNRIQTTIPVFSCTFEWGPQTLTGVGYQTVGSSPNREITVTIKDMTTVLLTATPGCAALIDPTPPLVGEWTTAKMIMTGESTGGVMGDAWFI